MTIQIEEVFMSGSSNPSISQQNEGDETEPYWGASAAPSLGAPAPDSDDEADAADDANEFATPDADIKGDADQVT